MLNQRLWSLSLCLFGIALIFQACLKDECEATQTFTVYNPIYKTVDEIRQTIQILSPQELENPGKLYFYNDYIFINEIREGVHIIDNSDASNPQNVLFIAIPGSVDMAVKENILYVDNYIDLLAIDISNPTNPVVQSRTEDVFNSISLHDDLGHLVDYEESEETIEIHCQDPRFYQNWFYFNDASLQNSGSPVAVSNTNSGSGGNAPAGIAGSMARFALADCYLYAIDNQNIQVFNIENTPIHQNTVSVDWGIETLFPTNDNLFIGSQSGMFIYDLSNPAAPSYRSQFQHATACDPVFVSGDHAFVTLRDGNFCNNADNQLDVIDISNLNNPTLVESYDMQHPHGLSVKDNTLYLCEGTHGLKVFSIENLFQIDDNQLGHFDQHAYDVIALPNKEILLLIGEDGFYQYDTSDKTNLKQLSVIPVL